MNSNLRIAMGIVIIVLGLLVVLTPRFILPVCDYRDKESTAGSGMAMAATMTAAQNTTDDSIGTMTGSTSMSADDMAADDSMTGTTSTSGNMNQMTTTNMNSAGTTTNSDDSMAGMDMDNGSAASTSHMRCYYTSRGALMMGPLIMLIGVAVLLATKRESVRLLALVLGGAGLGVLLMPLYILPVCENEQMGCHHGAEQSLIVMGAFIMVIAAVLALAAGRDKPTESE